MQFSNTWIPAIGGLFWKKTIFLSLFLPHFSWSQIAFEIGPSSEITINGTSSLHDWVSTVNKITGGANINLSGEKILGIQNLNVTIPVTAIKSGKKSMDKNTYEALQSKEHPEIKYVLTQYDVQPENVLNTTGKLQIAGISKSAQMQVSYTIHSPEKVAFTGEIKINMTEFNVDPPTALLGTIKTGEEITINFKVFFVQS